MRKTLKKSVRYSGLLEMMYLFKDGQISKRRIKVIQVGEESFRAYCYLRQSKRTFRIDNVLALVPILNYRYAKELRTAMRTSENRNANYGDSIWNLCENYCCKGDCFKI